MQVTRRGLEQERDRKVRQQPQKGTLILSSSLGPPPDTELACLEHAITDWHNRASCTQLPATSEGYMKTKAHREGEAAKKGAKIK